MVTRLQIYLFPSAFKSTNHIRRDPSSASSLSDILAIILAIVARVCAPSHAVTGRFFLAALRPRSSSSPAASSSARLFLPSFFYLYSSSLSPFSRVLRSFFALRRSLSFRSSSPRPSPPPRRLCTGTTANSPA